MALNKFDINKLVKPVTTPFAPNFKLGSRVSAYRRGTRVYDLSLIC